MYKLSGVIVAIPTPLLKNEDIDIASVKKLVDHCIAEGANGLMILGSMGEGVSITDTQKQLLVNTIVDHNNSRIKIMGASSTPSTRRCIEELKKMESWGLDALVCTTPSYYKYPDMQSMISHVEAASKAVSLPLVFYNSPGFSGNTVDVQTLDTIINMDNVIGIKDSSGNFGAFTELLRRYPDKNTRPASIMQGDESVYDASLLMGADGMVSGGGVLYISLLRKLYEAGINGDKEIAMKYQKEFWPSLFKLINPNPMRNWIYNIKKEMVERKIIDHAFVTSPFLMTE
ncbi:MAG: dihydrodipicolinate synthase family protein [Ginsengibacter sp.]